MHRSGLYPAILLEAAFKHLLVVFTMMTNGHLLLTEDTMTQSNILVSQVSDSQAEYQRLTRLSFASRRRLGIEKPSPSANRYRRQMFVRPRRTKGSMYTALGDTKPKGAS